MATISKTIALLTLLAAFAFAHTARAQLSLDTTSLPNSARGVASVDSAEVMDPYELNVLVGLEYLRNPLVLYDGDERAARLISNRLQTQLTAGIGLFEWFEVGVGLPLTLLQLGDDAPKDAVGALPEKRSFFGSGDARLFAKSRILRNRGNGVDLALGLSLFAPTAFPRSNFLGHEGLAFRPDILISKNAGPLRFASQLSYLLRPKVERLGAITGHEVQSKIGAEIDFSSWNVPLRSGVSMDFFVPVSPLFASIEDLKTEWRVSTAYSFNAFEGEHSLFVHVGGGLLRGIGTPDLRVIGGWRFARDVTKVSEKDKDQDGVRLGVDLCEDLPEDIDGFEDEDGCPDTDDDQDGVPDVQDQCKDAPEDIDGFDDEDGCPDTDNDQDGVADEFDRCPDVVEDKDGFQDEDGCPELDNDRDGVEDSVDQCPNVQGSAKYQGCPQPKKSKKKRRR